MSHECQLSSCALNESDRMQLGSRLGDGGQNYDPAKLRKIELETACG